VLGFLGPNGAGDASQLDAALRRLGGGGIRTLVSRPPTPEERFLRRYGSGQASAGAAAGDGQGTRPGAGR
jgi:ABC-2 type transport system ATP-binding protein